MKKFNDYKGITCTLYKSNDPHNTSVYFTNEENKKENKAYFEMLVFEYEYAKSTHFIKYPNTEYFVELSGGSGSSRGNMQSGSCTNPHKDTNNKLELFQQDINLLIKFNFMDFNFLSIAARSIEKDKLFHFRNSAVQELNPGLINTYLNEFEYLELPEDIRTIGFALKTEGPEPLYFITDSATYCKDYKTRARTIQCGEVKEYIVKENLRYRDGGTTHMILVDAKGEEFKFFWPTKLQNRAETPKVPLWNDKEKMVDMSNNEILTVASLLGIKIDKKQLDKWKENTAI